ncbi:hypothetical protein LC612_43225, partial [Nostoc sp. CHAB 5834]|nr:hypothetical protein [Nostoc sp. CHAB 5834]
RSVKNYRLLELCLTLTAEALALCGITESAEDGRKLAESLVSSGEGLLKLKAIIHAQGGDDTVIETPASSLPSAPIQLPVVSSSEGYLQQLSARSIGQIVVRLGGGRERKEDTIDPAVGIVLHKSIGDSLSTGESIATIHARDLGAAQRASEAFAASYEVSATSREQPELVNSILRM